MIWLPISLVVAVFVADVFGLRRTVHTLISVAIVCTVLMVLAGCAPGANSSTTYSEGIKFPDNRYRFSIDRQGPDEYGVVCYTAGSVAMSCIKVTAP